jgi:hypothetical protein
MADFRVILAHEVAFQIEAIVLPERCPDCKHPLMLKEDQGIPHCWFCTVDRIAAQRGRTALTKARCASQGIIIDNKIYEIGERVA